MTAIIVGILAALGIGGGFVIANNSGGSSSSGGAAIVQISGEKQDYTANDINPDYSLISAITDQSQYQTTIGDEGAFFEQYNSASGLHKHLLGEEINYDGYGDPEDDLRNGFICGKQFQIAGVNFYSILDLIKITNSFYIISLKANSVDNYGNVQIYLNAFNLTAANFVASGNSRYKTYKEYEETPSSDGQYKFKHYNNVYLGGAALGLTVADFGHWEEKAWKEYNGNQVFDQNSFEHNTTFFFYDERFAYKNKYYKSTATMQGNVLVSVLSDDNAYNLQTGSISMDLDLVSRKITNGHVVMDNIDYQEDYNADFTGAISGSVFKIDGTGWQDVPPEVGKLRGGVGKLLVGKDGLEMVGNFSKQIIYKEEWTDSDGTRRYERGKADYTFGAKEIN